MIEPVKISMMQDIMLYWKQSMLESLKKSVICILSP